MNAYGTLLDKAPLSQANQRSTSARPAPDLPASGWTTVRAHGGPPAAAGATPPVFLRIVADLKGGGAPQAALPHQGGSANSQQGTKKLPDVLAFRDYTLVPKSRQLRRNRQDVEIGGRAFDLLTLLVSSRGQVVTKEQILSYVWPSMVVEESNLRFQMAALRKVLGNDRDMIKTVAGRGYIVVADDEIGVPVDEIHLPTSHVCEVVASGESYDQQSFDATTPELETPAGAVNPLTKPLRHEKLLAAVQSAVACEAPQAFV
jgi:DNA-binding winged helix-turn-helix (wHTH) protein